MPGRIRAFVVSVLVAGFSSPALSQEAGRISRVTLYPGSAAIERSARVGLGAGTLQMSGLPANFDLRTLRVEADAGIRIGEVSVQDVGRAQALGSREAELDAKIQALKDEKAALDVDVKTAELVRDYLASLSRRSSSEEGSGRAPIAVDPKAIPTVIEAIRRGGSDAYGTIQKIEIKKRGIDKDIAALERDLARLRGGGRKIDIEFGTIEGPLRLSGGGTWARDSGLIVSGAIEHGEDRSSTMTPFLQGVCNEYRPGRCAFRIMHQPAKGT